jgi:hypothetical protein
MKVILQAAATKTRVVLRFSLFKNSGELLAVARNNTSRLEAVSFFVRTVGLAWKGKRSDWY